MKRVLLVMVALVLAPAIAFAVGQPFRKQSTSTYPIVFFMVDSSDHVTAKTGLAPAVTCYKNGGGSVTPSGAITELGNGWYKIAGNTTDTNTLGTLACTATAASADPRPLSLDVVTYDPFTYPDTSATIAGVTTATNVTNAVTANVINSGTAQAGGSTSVTLAAGASATDSIYNGQLVVITGSTGAGQVRTITAYVGSTKVATVDHAWQTNPTGSSTYITLAEDSAALDSSLQVAANAVNGSVTGSTNSVVTRVTANVDQVDGVSLATHVSGHFPVDLLKIAGATLDTTLAQIGVNVVKFGGTSGTFASGRPEVNTTHFAGTLSTGAGGYVGLDWGHITAPTTTQNLSGTTIAAVSGATGSVTGAVTVGTNNDKTGYTLTQAFPSNFSSLAIGGTGHVTNVDTLTTYTGNTPQTGDSFARLGAPVSASISADVANVYSRTDVATSTRMATFSLPTNFSAFSIDSSGRIDAGKILGAAIDPTVAQLGVNVVDYTTGDPYTRLGAPVGASVSADIAAVKSDVDALSVPTTSEIADAVWDDIHTLVENSGIAQGGSLSSVTLASGASSIDSLYVGSLVKLHSGTGVGQVRVVTAYNGTTKIAKVNRPWVVAPVYGTGYSVLAISEALN